MHLDGIHSLPRRRMVFTQIQRATGISDIDTLVRQFIENEDQNFKMFNYLNGTCRSAHALICRLGSYSICCEPAELNQEIEKGEEQINELKQETEKYRGQDKGAASQRKRLIRDLQERTVDVEAKTAQYEDAYKVLNASIAAISRSSSSAAGRTPAPSASSARWFYWISCSFELVGMCVDSRGAGCEAEVPYAAPC